MWGVANLNRNRVCTGGLKICASSECSDIDKFEESRIIQLDKCCFWGHWEAWSGSVKLVAYKQNRNRTCKCGNGHGTAEQCVVGIQVNTGMLTRMIAVFGTTGENGQELDKLVAAQSEREKGLVCVELWLDSEEKCNDGRGKDLQIVKQEPCTTTHKPVETCAWDTWGVWSGIS
eukprot:TRINITY_DN13766_c0_g1_i1.p1 TRINITY_DN13766_c0_g1~~TRINITY_DN13766_c0_g1_i1.p1  ORF type:complete len:174 (-),score=22.29 TRINITY_DN13766_c0_g1_i1:107-628(-)